MSEPATNTAHPAPGARFAAKAAGGAVIAALGLFVVIYIAVSMPQKLGGGWRAALPSPAMSETETAGALLQAKYLHEAAVRPQLIRAGFASAGDVAVQTLRAPALSRDVTEALWTMRPFPELHDAMLAMLTDTAVPVKERLTRLFQFGAFLDSAASAIAYDGKKGKRPAPKSPHNPALRLHTRDWFLFYTDNPRLNPQQADSKAAPADKALRAAYAEKLAFARRVLPQLLADISKDAAARLALAQEGGDSRKKSAAWGGASRDRYMASLDRAVAKAARAMWQNRAVPGFSDAARAFVASNEAPLAELYAIVPLLAKKPGLPAAEYVFWYRHKDSLANFSECIGSALADDVTARYVYAYRPGGELETTLREALEAGGAFPLEGHDGPGVALSRVKTLLPGADFSGSLYLLADTREALKDAPAYDFNRAQAIFGGTVLRYLESQPLVLPLNLNDAADKALVNWYAAKGWREGRILLFSAEGSPVAVARHWGGLLLAWWTKADGRTVPAYIHPQSGHFMSALLPALRGQGVTRFFGPMTGLWFGSQAVDADGWTDELYSAKPEGQTSLPAARKPLRSPLLDWARGKTPEAEARPEAASVVFGKEITEAARQSLRHDRAVTLGRLLDQPPHDAAMPPAAICAFAGKAVSDLQEWGFSSDAALRQGVELLWQNRKNGKNETVVREGLADTSLSPSERLRNVCRALNLPVQKGN